MVRFADLQAAHLIRGQLYVVRPVPLKVGTGDFAFAAGHDLPTLRFAVVRRRTDGAGGFFSGPHRAVPEKPLAGVALAAIGLLVNTTRGREAIDQASAKRVVLA